MILGQETIPWLKFDVYPNYKYQLTKFCGSIEELSFAIEQFRNNVKRHCCIRMDSTSKRFAVYTEGYYLTDDNKSLEKRRDL